MKLSQQSINKLKRLEGFRAKAYIPVPGDVPTIGYGSTEGVKMGDTITEQDASARLIAELRKYENAVFDACKTRPNQNQFDAMVLLCYNIGVGGFKKSSVLKAHNRGDFAAAARAFGLWNKSGGKVYQGLVKRRADEAALYLTPVDDEEAPAPEPVVPQTVDAERPMTASTINRAGVVAGGSAAVATVAETVNTVGYIKRGVDDLQDWIVPILLIVSVLAVGYIIWERVNLRKSGIA